MEIYRYFIAASVFMFFSSFLAGAIWGTAGFAWAFSIAGSLLGIGCAIVWLTE